MPSNTQIKIRHGLILQAVLAQALRNAGYSFEETPNYDADSEVPDFLIPDAENPEFMLEVHQTEARNHFQMKTLRSVTAVAEAKAFFGADVVSVNVLFGDPDSELPAANLRAMCGIFDVNLVLRRDANAAGRTAIATMEAAALELAGDTDVTTTDAARRLVAAHGAAVREFQRLLTNALDSGEVKESLRPMWVAEAARRAELGEPPAPGATTYYKKNMVRSLFFQDDHFATMAADPTPNAWDQAIVRQVVATGIGTVTEEIDGDHLDVDAEFLAFLRDPDAPRLRGLCKEVLDATPSMHWFFEDIRDERRRRRMAAEFLRLSTVGRMALQDAIVSQLGSEIFKGIDSCRCWVADLLAFRTGASQNEFNRLMVQRGRDPENYQYPFNHVSGRFERLLGCPHHFDRYASFVLDTYEDVCNSAGIGAYIGMPSEAGLADGLLTLRLFGASRLQNLNPLHILIETQCADLGIVTEETKLKSLIHDLGGATGRLGKYDVVLARRSGVVAVVVTIAAYENPRDKAKEWGARRLATLYRMIEGVVTTSGLENAIFVIDGTWAQSDLNRLFHCGWTRVVRLGQLDATLRDVFGLHAATDTRQRRRPIRIDAADLSDLPMAAED
jgi:hypothetical protein